MIIEYSQSSANKLTRLSVPDITEPFFIKIYWMRGLSAQNGRKTISRKRHKHSFYEAHFIINGEMTYTAENQTNILKNGQGILFAPEIPHTVESFSEDLVKFSLAFLPEKALFEFLTPSCFLFSLNDKIKNALEELLAETERRSIFSKTVIKNRILDIIYEFTKETKTLPFDYSLDENPVCDMVKQYICDNENVFLTCKAVAKQFHFNEKYLNRIFRQQTDQPLLEYIHSSKIKSAEKFLADKSYSLNEISLALGFKNEYYFNTFFKKQTGITPGLYRKLLLKK